MKIWVKQATDAARRGDAESLELNLARLRLVSPGRVDDLADRLRSLLRSVQSHPSFRRSTGQRPASATG